MVVRNTIYFSVFLLILIKSIGIGEAATDNNLGRIIFANILYRHGDRTPIEPYPTDPYNSESDWPVPYGQLTNIGKHQHLLLGQWLRKRYIHLLSQTYTPYDIYIQSTDVDRTLMSAEANLAGLYPPEGSQIWDISKWMPIPVHTVPEDEDYILAGKKYCARYNFELQRVLDSPEMERINEKYKEIYEFLTNKTGMKVSCLKTAEHVYDTLFIENRYNKTLPEWTKSVFPEKLIPIARESFKINAYNKILQRLKSGNLLGNMIDHMVKKSENMLKPDRKLWMYSAHDETVANMLMTLDLFEPHCPPYTATILIELRTLNQEYFVTVSYKNSSDEARLLTLPGCTQLCPLNSFIKLTKHAVPENWEKECSMHLEKYLYNVDATTVVAIFSTSVLVLILLVLSIIAFTYWRYKREHNQYYFRLSTDPIM